MAFQRAAGWCETARVRRGNTSRSCPLNCEGIRGESGAPVIARGASAPVEAVFVRRRQARGGTAKFRPLLVGAEGVFILGNTAQYRTIVSPNCAVLP